MKTITAVLGSPKSVDKSVTAELVGKFFLENSESTGKPMNISRQMAMRHLLKLQNTGMVHMENIQSDYLTGE